MGVEMLVRSAFGWSVQFSNEIGGYALVAITFLSLGSGQLLHAYHRVHFLDGAPRRRRAAPRCDFCSTSPPPRRCRAAVRRVARFEWITWKSGDVAATSLMTPLWMPRLVMPHRRAGAGLGAAAHAGRRLATPACRGTPAERRIMGEYQIIFIFILFLGLLAAGMAVPFAILLPGMRLPVPARRHRRAARPGPRELGQHGQLHAHLHPAVRADGRVPAGQRPGPARLPRPLAAGAQGAGRAAADQHRRLRGVRRRQRLQHRHRRGHRQGGAAAAQGARLRHAPGHRFARGRRHAGHPDPALDRDDRLRHLHRDLGGQAVHGGRGAGHRAHADVHGLRRGGRA